MATYKCAVPYCDEDKTSLKHLMCLRHWGLVPENVQLELVRMKKCLGQSETTVHMYSSMRGIAVLAASSADRKES